jgi:hypothetical protein
MKYLMLLTLIVFSGCIPGPEDLGVGYVLGYNNNTLDRVIQIYSPKGGLTLAYFKDSIKIVRYFKNEDWIVDSYVSKAVYDNEFILIDQKPIDSICECNQECLVKKYPDYNNLPTAQMCDDAIKNAAIHLFYIIDKKTNTLYGPMAKNIFYGYLKKLNVDKDLKLEK